MNRFAIVSVLTALILHAVEGAWPISVTVTERGAVTVEIPPVIRAATHRQEEGAFADELRILNSKGEYVPYVLRPCQIRQTDRRNGGHSWWTSAPAFPVRVACRRTEEANPSTTILTFNACHVPAMGLATSFPDTNFSRRIRVERLTNGRWREFARGQIKVLDLPGQSVYRQELHWPVSEQAGLCRLVIDNGDSPPLKGDETKLLRLLVRPEEVVFLAEPDERYSLDFVKDARRPRYDEALASYLNENRETLLGHLEVDPSLVAAGLTRRAEGHGAPLPGLLAWLAANGMKLATCLAFLILLGVCLSLFRPGTKRQKPATKHQEPDAKL